MISEQKFLKYDFLTDFKTNLLKYSSESIDEMKMKSLILIWKWDQWVNMDLHLLSTLNISCNIW